MLADIEAIKRLLIKKGVTTKEEIKELSDAIYKKTIEHLGTEGKKEKETDPRYLDMDH